MNKNQANGMAKDVLGKVQETRRKIIGNPSQEVKGRGKANIRPSRRKIGRRQGTGERRP